ncbi:hypothetical protein KHA80_11535 [Anaerobacillus sp. HL2]|nr:hypothetical protein KHA80_11535 [Anaerobacillus sp. HL2]
MNNDNEKQLNSKFNMKTATNDHLENRAKKKVVNKVASESLNFDAVDEQDSESLDKLTADEETSAKPNREAIRKQRRKRENETVQDYASSQSGYT